MKYLKEHISEELLYLLANDPQAGSDAERAHLAVCEECQHSVAVLESVCAEIAVEPPSVFQSRKMERGLNVLLDKEIHAQRRAWRPVQVVAALALACFSGASLAYVAFEAKHNLEEERAQSAQSATVSAKKNESSAEVKEAPVLAPKEQLSDVLPPPKTKTLASRSQTKRRLKVKTESLRERTFRLASEYEDDSCKVAMIDVADQLELERDFNKAARLYSGALCSLRGREAAQKLQTQVRRGDVDAILVSEMIRQNPSSKASAEGGRLLCEWGLKYRKNGMALHDCAAFLKQHPDENRAQILSFAAGRVSARTLKDKKRALPFFSFAIEHNVDDVTQNAALFERAKAYAHLARYVEAEEDLSLYRRRVAPELRREGYDELARTLENNR